VVDASESCVSPRVDGYGSWGSVRPRWSEVFQQYAAVEAVTEPEPNSKYGGTAGGAAGASAASRPQPPPALRPPSRRPPPPPAWLCEVPRAGLLELFFLGGAPLSRSGAIGIRLPTCRNGCLGGQALGRVFTPWTDTRPTFRFRLTSRQTSPPGRRCPPALRFLRS
jgi:hypothetical protein